MDKRNLTKYAKQLEEKRQSLLTAFRKKMSLGSEATTEDAADMVDLATDSYTQEFLSSLSNTDRTLLKAVEDALAHIEDGEYGQCVECEEKMGKKRLDAIPWAQRCVACQELVESGRLKV